MRFKLPQKYINTVSIAVIGAAMALLVVGTIYYAQQEKRRIAIEEQTSVTNQLVEEVRGITEQNRELNEINRNYTLCVANIIARYTQEQEPIVIEDLDKCIFEASGTEVAPQPLNAPSSNTPEKNEKKKPSPTQKQKDTPPQSQSPRQSFNSEPYQTSSDECPQLLFIRLC